MGWRRVHLLLVIMVLSLLAAACGGDSNSTSPTNAGQDGTSSSSTTVSSDPTSPEQPGGTTQDDDGDVTQSSLRAGAGSYSVNEISFDGVGVFRCEPFSFPTGGPHPGNISIWGYPDELQMDALNVEVLHDLRFGGDENDTLLAFSVFLSLQGENGVEQFEGFAKNDKEGNWFIGDIFDGGSQLPLSGAPFVINGNRITGSFAGVTRIWPDDPSVTVNVTFDLEIPSEIDAEC